jgi:uncharacterized protein
MKTRSIFIRMLTVIFLMSLTGFVKAQVTNATQNDTLLTKSIGVWEGTLVVDSTMKIPVVFKIKQDEQQKLAVTLDSPSQNAFDIPGGDITNEAGQLKIDCPEINGNYIGKFSNPLTLEGTWTQNGNSLPLTLTKKKDAK